MTVFSSEFLRDLGTRLFVACGSSAGDARTVADVLVEASLMGLDSHGVIRYVDYAKWAMSGQIKPNAEIRVIQQTASTSIVDCGGHFGPVSAMRTVEIVSEQARRNGMAAAVCVRSN